LTYAAAMDRCRGRTELFMVIDGLPVVIGTGPDAPVDAWYATGGWGYMRGLRSRGLRISCQAHPGEVWPTTSALTVEIDDPDEALSQLLLPWENCGRARLSASVTATAGSIEVDSSADLPDAPAVVWCELEAIKYEVKGATALSNLTHGYYGTLAADHIVDENVLPPRQPEVYDGPGDLRGRRVTIWGAEQTDTGLSASEQIWLAVVSGDLDFQPGLVRIPLRHPLGVWQDSTVFGSPPTGRCRGVYLPNVDNARLGQFQYSVAGSALMTLNIVADGLSELFENSDDLVERFLAGMAGVADWEAIREADGRLRICYTGTGSNPHFSVQGTIAQVLGFQVIGGESGLFITTADGRRALYPPANFFIPIMTFSPADFQRKIYLREGEALWFAESGIVLEGVGAAGEGALLHVDYINTVMDFIAVSRIPAGGVGALDSLASFEGAPPPTVRQLWELDNSQLHEVIRALWAGGNYGAFFDYDIPRSWLAGADLRDSDVDWDRLEELVTISPSVARCITMVITEPTAVTKVLAGHLLACGIYACIKRDGTVGWEMAEVPAVQASMTTVGPAETDAGEAPGTVTVGSRDSIINVIQLELKGESGEDYTRKVLVVDQESVGRYGPRLARDVSVPAKSLDDAATKLELNVADSWILTSADIGMELARHLGATIMGLLGRPRSGAEIGVTPALRSVEIGDLVSLTSPWVRDGMTGQCGVKDKVALVLGWQATLGQDDIPDRLDLLLIDDPPGCICPAALATAYNASIKKLSFADTNIYHRADQVTDLDYFAAGDTIWIYDYDSETPSRWSAVIASVDPVAGEIILTSYRNIVGTSWVVTFNRYKYCTLSQRSGGWVWLADDADGDVGNYRHGWRWS